MASGTLTDEELEGIDPYKSGFLSPNQGRRVVDINLQNQRGAQWQPTFSEVREADFRLNTITGAAQSLGKSKEQKEIEEREAREVLHFGSFGQNVAASLSQYENLGITAASILLPPLGFARGASIAGRVGAAAAINAGQTAVQEGVLHSMEETRTLQESAFSVIGAAVIGGGLSGVGEGVARMYGRQMGAAEKSLRETAFAEGRNIETDVGRQIHELAHSPVTQQPDVPLTMRLHDQLTAPGKDDSIGAARVNPDEHITSTPDTPAAYSLDQSNPNGPREQDSVNPGMRKIIDSVGDGFFGKSDLLSGLQTWGGRMSQSPFQQAKSLAAELLPNVTRTQIAASGKGKHMDLYSRVRAVGNRFFVANEKIRAEGMADYRKQITAMTPDQHLALVDELATRGNMDRLQAMQFVDDAVTAASKGKLLKNVKDDGASLSHLNFMTTLAARNGDTSVLAAVGRRASRIRQEIFTPGIERGARAGKYDAAWLTNERNTAQTYFPRVFDKDALELNQGKFIEDVAPFLHSEDPKVSQKQAAENLWRHLTTDGDDLARVDVSGTGVNFTKGVKLDMLPDNVIAPYLVNDADQVINQVVRRYQRDIATSEHFGTPEWTVALNQKKDLIHAELENKLVTLRNEATDPVLLKQQEAKLVKRLQEDIRELDYAVDEALGKSPRLNGTVQAIKAGTSGMFLGRAIFANIADLHATKTADIITKYIPGFFQELGEASRRIFRDPSLPESVQREQAKRFGTIVGHAQSEMLYHSMHDTVNELQKQNVRGFNAAMSWMGTATHIASGMKAFNETGKKLHTTDIIDRTIAVMKGKRTLSADEVTDLGRYSFGVGEDAKYYGRIKDQVLLHSEELDGVHYANIDKWTDHEAADFYNAFVNKYVDTKVLMPDPSTKMMAERNDFGSAFFQFTSFIRAFIDKQLIPTAEAGVPAMLSMYLKLATLNYMGAYAREYAYGKPDENGDPNQQRIALRALGNTLLVPSSILMAVLKVADSTVGNFGELVGLDQYRQQRETFAVTGAIKRIGKGVIIDGINMATSDEPVSDERKEKYWLNLMGMVPIINTPLMELPGRLVIKQFHENE